MSSDEELQSRRLSGEGLDLRFIFDLVKKALEAQHQDIDDFDRAVFGVLEAFWQVAHDLYDYHFNELFDWMRLPSTDWSPPNLPAEYVEIDNIIYFFTTVLFERCWLEYREEVIQLLDTEAQLQRQRALARAEAKG